MDKKTTMEFFSERLKDLRNEMGLSTTQLGKAISVGSSTISRWERGLQIPNIEYLVALAEYFKVSAGYLCGLED